MKLQEIVENTFKNKNTVESAQELRKAFFDSGAYSVTWRHIRRGADYMVASTAVRESDLEVLVLYFPASQNAIMGPERLMWSRPLKEFLDGRFQPKE